MPLINPGGGSSNPPTQTPTKYPGYSGLDFNTLYDQLAWWLNPGHITQRFKGGYAGSGENGIDIGLPHGTPVYSMVSGTVVGEGYYGGGGVVSVESSPGTVWYFQHLDLNLVKVGDQISSGEEIGLSGGQLSGGHHPATCCSGGDHIEVGINGPFGANSIWHPEGPNVNPLTPLLNIMAFFKNADVPTYGSYDSSYVTQDPTQNPSGGSSGETSTGTQHCWSLPLGLPSFCVSNTVYNWITQPIRWLKLFGGFALLFAGFILFALPTVVSGAGTATQVAGAVTGQPEVFMAGSAISGAGRKRSRQSYLRKAANRPKATPETTKQRIARRRSVGAAADREERDQQVRARVSNPQKGVPN